MAETNGSYNSERLDRIERIVEVLATTQADMANTQSSMQQDIKNLYRSQVVMGETLNKLAERHNELVAAQKHADERMDALILTVDEIVRGRKRE